jgi:GTP pyrophosphokinase
MGEPKTITGDERARARAERAMAPLASAEPAGSAVPGDRAAGIIADTGGSGTARVDGVEPKGAGACSRPPPGTSRVERALALATEAVGDTVAPTGEGYLAHAIATIGILREIGADETTHVAAALVEPAALLPLEAIEREFGAETARLVEGMRQIRRLGALRPPQGGGGVGQTETLRRMLLAMASDIRVVLLRLASRLQTLRYHAAVRQTPDPALSRETLEVLASLANRLGLWQLKWELEDLSFRFLEPETYRRLARELEERRVEREAFVARAATRLQQALAGAGVQAQVSGRPKHIYSIWNKMRSKGRSLDGISDLRGLRVIVDTVAQCYAALDIVHGMWTALPAEYDDYISRPKPNGYRSLHTVVTAEDGRTLEVQIRTFDMHRFAEYGVASHWRYKERSGAAAGSAGERARTEQAFEDRITWMRQLLAWQREVGEALGGAAAPKEGNQAAAQVVPEERIYVLTPAARVIELPAGATPVDFAYQVHTALGHRCRGARVDGQMVPLNTVLQNGQTVEIIAAKSSDHEGPSLDWLNPQLGYLRSARTRSKVRQWFNARELERDAANGRERVEKVLQREGRTALAFEELARRLGFSEAGQLFVAVAREEIGPRQLEEAVRHDPSRDSGRTAIDEPDLASIIAGRRRSGAGSASGDGVLVVGIDSLLTQLARCCRPVPPDPIVGFVTHGRGVSVHRRACSTFARLASRSSERVIETTWGDSRLPASDARSRRYPVDIEVRAADRTGLLRDIVETLARDRVNVLGMQTATRRQEARMRFTVEVSDGEQLKQTLSAVRGVPGVGAVRRA